MKNIVRLLLLAGAVSVATPALAQPTTVFAPLGAEWWYHVSTVGGPHMTRVYVVGDTILPGRVGWWQVLHTQFFGYVGNNTYAPGNVRPFAYTQCRGDQVWVVNGAAEQLLLDFGTLPGADDTVSFCAGGAFSGHGLTHLDSVGTRVMSSVPLRVQWRSASTGTSHNELRQYSGDVVERLGYPYAQLIPFPECPTDPDYPQLLSYSDGVVIFGQRPRILGRPEAPVSPVPTVAPNPSTTGRFALTGLTDQPVGYAVLDARGRQVQGGQLTGAAPEINLATLPAGLYLLRGTVAGRAFTRRLVRE